MNILDSIQQNVIAFSHHNHGLRPNVLIMHYKSYFDLLGQLGNTADIHQTMTFEGMKIIRTQDIGEGEIELGRILK